MQIELQSWSNGDQKMVIVDGIAYGDFYGFAKPDQRWLFMPRTAMQWSAYEALRAEIIPQQTWIGGGTPRYGQHYDSNFQSAVRGTLTPRGEQIVTAAIAAHAAAEHGDTAQIKQALELMAANMDAAPFARDQLARSIDCFVSDALLVARQRRDQVLSI